MGKLTLDGNVSLQRLQQFAQEAGDQSIRLKEKNGVQILYTSNKTSTGLKNFVTGQTDERRDAGRAKLTELLGQHAENARTAIGADANTNRLDNLPQGTKLTGTTLSAAITDIQNAITTKVSDRTTEARLARAQGDIPMALLALKYNDPEGLKGATQQLGKSLATNINAQFSNKPDEAAKQRTEFLTMTSDKLIPQKDAYLKQLALDAAPNGAVFTTSYANAPPEIKKFVDDIFNQAAANLPGNTLGKKNEDGVFKEVTINGQTFVHDKKLAEGGFGKVHLYHLKSDPNQTIVLKEPKTPPHNPGTGDAAKKANAVRAEFIDGTRDEASTHSRIGADQNVVKLLGVVTDEHGAVWTALENCVHGDAFEVTQGIHDKTSNASENARTAAALTLLHDQAKGLAKMHGEGVTHQDYKGANVMVSKGGVGKLADFGTSGGAKVQGRVGGVEIKVAKDNVDNPTWVSPLRLYGRDAKAGAQTAKTNQLKKAALNEVGKMMGLPSIEKVGNYTNPKLTDAEKQTLVQRFGAEEGPKVAKQLENDLKTLLKKIGTEVDEEFADKTMTFSEKADVWAFGVVAYQTLFNKGTELPPGLHADWNADIEKNLKEYRAAGLRGEAKPIFDGPPDSLTAQQKFINWLMPPKEEDAPSMQQIVNHPIFKELLGEGVVGSKEARDLIESSAALNKLKGDAETHVKNSLIELDVSGFDANQFTANMEGKFPLQPTFADPWYKMGPNQHQEVVTIGNLLSRAPANTIDALASEIVQTLNMDLTQAESINKAVNAIKQQQINATNAQLKAQQLDALIVG